MLYQERFWLYIRNNSFSARVVRQRHRLPSEVVKSLSLDVFKDVALRVMVSGHGRGGWVWGSEWFFSNLHNSTIL